MRPCALPSCHLLWNASSRNEEGLFADFAALARKIGCHGMMATSLGRPRNEYHIERLQPHVYTNAENLAKIGAVGSEIS